MMEINLDLVKSSPNPIRKTWDEQKMQELAQSIKEQGVIVPIKVRPSGEEYEIVYGHRRVEAAKRAGLEGIPAIVETPDDEMVIWEALIENLSNEDMPAYEKGEEIEKLKQKGFSIAEQSRKIGAHVNLLKRWRDYYLERSSGLKIDTAVSNEKVMHIKALRETVGDDLPVKQAILDKAIKENTNENETREIARAYVKADTPELKQSVLETSGKLGDSGVILSVAKRKVGEEFAREVKQEEKKQKLEDKLPELAKQWLDADKKYRNEIGVITDAIASDLAVFSPEGIRFVERRIGQTISKLAELGDVLDEQRN